jgi:hypothetical protein
MTRYSLSWLFLAIIVAVSSFHDDFTSRLSQSEIYKILLGMVVVCFAVGKIWPNLFNKKDTNIQPSSSVGKEVKEDAEYYVRHKKLTAFSIAALVILLLLSSGQNRPSPAKPMQPTHSEVSH